MFQGKAWRAPAFGAPKDVLRLEETTWEEPAEGRVLVKVDVCGTGYPDVYIVGGAFPTVPTPPAFPGQEVVGEVVAAPPGARFAVGDRVMGFTPFMDGLGGLGEYAYCWEEMTRLVPAPLTDEEAAGFLLAFKTAHQALVGRAALKSGEVLLVLGAAGSSGSAAIQLGKALGATVIAGASSDEKLAFCKGIGADHTVNYTTTDLAEAVRTLTDGRGADVVFDPMGGDIATQATKAVAAGGRFTLVGFASGSFAGIDPMSVMLGNYSVVGVYGGLFTAEQDRHAIDEVCRLAEQGAVRTPVGTVYPFAEAPEAIERIRSGSAVGKSVVRVSH